MSEIELPQDAPGPWAVVRELAELLPPDWVLIGATIDVDVLGQARPQGALQAIDTALDHAGFEALPPDEDGYAYRYVRGDLIVDVLAPTA